MKPLNPARLAREARAYQREYWKPSSREWQASPEIHAVSLSLVERLAQAWVELASLMEEQGLPPPPKPALPFDMSPEAVLQRRIKRLTNLLHEEG